MKNSVRLLIFLTLVLFLFSGCAEVAPETQDTTEMSDESTTEASLAPSESEELTTEVPPTEEDTPDALVTDGFSASFTDPITSETYNLALPKIHLDGAYADEINEKITERYAQFVDDDGVVRIYGNFSYEFYIYGDILSVVTRDSYPEPPLPDEFACAYDHRVYTLHISDGSEASADEILAAANVAPEELYERASELMGKIFCIRCPEYMLESHLAMPEENLVSGLFLDFVDTICEENAMAVRPYLREDGMLCFAGYIYQIAGEDRNSRLFSYDEELESPYYEPLLEKVQPLLTEEIPE